jgi:hypothetical protein
MDFEPLVRFGPPIKIGHRQRGLIQIAAVQLLNSWSTKCW